MLPSPLLLPPSSAPCPTFHLTVLGSSGGPLDGKTCSYLLHTLDLSILDIVQRRIPGKLICVDAGVGLSAINEIILNERSMAKLGTPEILRSYSDSLDLERYISCATSPFNAPHSGLLYETALEVLNSISDYLITHPHLDHIAGLVINLAGLDHTRTTNVWGLDFTILALRQHIFNGVIWPNLLCAENGNFVQLNSFGNQKCEFGLGEDFSVCAFSVNHGVVSDGLQRQLLACNYPSNSFLIRSNVLSRSLLIFGDLETSSLNKQIWDAIAPLVALGLLAAIVIECSTCNVPEDTPLFGHLTPKHLLAELAYLGGAVGGARPLEGLQILVGHVKENGLGIEPRKTILAELQALEKSYSLGCVFSIALPGITYAL